MNCNTAPRVPLAGEKSHAWHKLVVPAAMLILKKRLPYCHSFNIDFPGAKRMTSVEIFIQRTYFCSYREKPPLSNNNLLMVGL